MMVMIFVEKGWWYGLLVRYQILMFMLGMVLVLQHDDLMTQGRRMRCLLLNKGGAR
jgi:hypothetical protein